MGDCEALQSYKIHKYDRNFVFCPSPRLVEVASAELQGLRGCLALLIVALNISYIFCTIPKIYSTCKPKKLGGFERCLAKSRSKLLMAANAEVHPQCLKGSCTPRGVQMTESCLPSNVERSRKTAFRLVLWAGERHLVLALSSALGCKTAHCEAFPKVFQLSIGYNVLPASCGE